MDVYTLVKLLHVLSVILWVGGGFVFVVLGVFASTRSDPAEIIAVCKNVALLSTRFFIPMALLTVIFGLITAFVGGLYGTLWVWIGLAGFVATFLTGALILGPNSEKLVAADKAGESAKALALAQFVLKTAKFDYVVLLLVISDMVLKPGFGDVTLLAIGAVVLIAGAILFLGDLVRRPAAATS
ncbi:MAG TPA: DUF2269 family protein [Devosiaceae bacterium]|jgi:uncharacterized membrane protein|nr:DUF2269 family protein [Devosiaceae bacterium]